MDGHSVTRGIPVFGGEPLSAAATAQLEDHPLLHSPIEPFIRWLVLLSGLALVGVLAFRLLVSNPSPGLE